jgi:hypothetical protein
MLRLAAIYIEGKALIWYQDMSESNLFNLWEGFANALLTRFGPSSYDDPMETIMRLKQYYIVENYKEKFEAISNILRGIFDHNKLSCSSSGLKDEIQLPVKMFNPPTLLEAFGLTKIQEEHVLTGRRNYRSSTVNFSISNTKKVGG